MCFSFEVSILTGVFMLAICMYILKYGKNSKETRNAIYMLLLLSSIQFADALLWFYKLEKNNLNFNVTSYLIPFILSSQFYFNIFIRNKPNIYTISLFVFSVLWMFIRFRGYSTAECNEKNSCNSPIWGSKEIKLWEVFLYAFLISFPDYKLVALGILIFLSVYFTFPGGYGSLWCATVVLNGIYQFVTMKTT